ncbi:MAG TPA: DeoR/GlpR family DNA-binding transcription regulator [Clostridia bacterium]|nr:DeoR/GlpR family DNA-binding transcription regulator [Clostridia bacterium]
MAKQNQVQSRHKKILQLLDQNEEVALPYLCKMLNCSETTVRNDLRALEQHGMLRRTFGGAIRLEEPPNLWLNINVREKAHASEKRDIARYAVDTIIKPNTTVVLDAGTTCAVLAQEIARRRIRMTIMTNSFHAAVALAPVLGIIELYVIGGMYNPVSGSMHDEFQLEAFRHLRADVFFMGADAVNEDRITITGLSGFAECASKRALTEMSTKTYVLADHSKFGRSGMKLVCNTDAVDGIITDSGVDDFFIKDMRARNVPLFVSEAGVRPD